MDNKAPVYTGDTLTFPTELGGETFSGRWHKSWTKAMKDYAKRTWNFFTDENDLIDPDDPNSEGYKFPEKESG